MIQQLQRISVVVLSRMCHYSALEILVASPTKDQECGIRQPKLTPIWQDGHMIGCVRNVRPAAYASSIIF